MALIISNAPRGNPTLIIKRLTATPEKLVLNIYSKPQPQTARTQQYRIILFNKYGLQVQLRTRQNSDCDFTNQLVKERYKNKPEARVFNRFSLTRAFRTFYKYRD
ncbi:hypothetical protein [Nostoc sp. FACHB-110]|uniref:hypothetical protein n=1 Tax=Nostoc sp. FACHB-110 TaxID=2692834 RepID=UPI0016860385|nr:hypothetical protein [Nostoc sp. FACHB-110]MBD2436225.1 hypothetical protein [Nostoc sp. FACHB-110]